MSSPSAMFAATFSLTMRCASAAAFGPPMAIVPIRIAITILASAPSIQASMPMLSQLGVLAARRLVLVLLGISVNLWPLI